MKTSVDYLVAKILQWGGLENVSASTKNVLLENL